MRAKRIFALRKSFQRAFNKKYFPAEGGNINPQPDEQMAGNMG
jgi:hypothetical protein